MSLKRNTPSSQADVHRDLAWRAAIAVLVALAAWQRWPGLAPYSLWLDDLWVAVLVKHASLGELLFGRGPCPSGFLLALRAITLVLGDGSWQLQLLPFLAGLAQVVLIGLVARKLTGDRWLGIVAAAVLAAEPTLATYSLRVKAFSLDGLAALICMWLAMSAAARPRPRAIVLLALAGLALQIVSFTSTFVSLAMVGGMAGCYLRWRGKSVVHRRAVAVSSMLYAVGTVGLYAIFAQNRATPATHAYWSDFYLPATDARAASAFLFEQGIDFAAGAFPASLWWLVLAVPVGLFALARQRRSQPIASGLILFYIGMLSASALKLYPLGGGRTDIFAYPLAIIAVVAGLRLGTRAIPFGSATLAFLALCSLGYSIAVSPCRYRASHDRTIVEHVNDITRDEDALVVYPWSSWALGYYGRWRVQFVHMPNSTNGFYVHPVRGNTLVLNETLDGQNFEAEPLVIWKQLRPFLVKRRPRRVIFMATTAAAQPLLWTVDGIRLLGYATTHEEAYEEAYLAVFERKPSDAR